ncbi:MAG: hypothetical protein COA99_05700 [Moraxellaceae bacterium]|nr:MAG: hypothetical protein COA99_05700 [Moraxellaceae bacterium]
MKSIIKDPLRPFLNPALASLLAGAIAIFASNSQASEDIIKAMQLAEDTKWYEVNIVIFKRKKPGFQAEQWQSREKLGLTFPPRTALLDDASYDEVDHSTIELEPLDELVPQEDQEQVDHLDPSANVKLASLPLTPTLQENTPPTTDNPIDVEATESTTPHIIAFRTVPTVDEEFKQTIQRLQNSRGYKILSQKTWRQPGLPANRSIPVLIQDGEQFDDNYELEGTINISLSRYLHVQSNLWLSDYVKQIELSKTWWEEPTFEDASALGEQGEFTGFTDKYQQYGSPQEGESLAIQQSEGDNNTGNMSDGVIDSLSLQESTAHYEAIRTVVLNESRRMRSDEMHYLDHPLFGMLIKILPYTPPLEEEMQALDEFDATPASNNR